MYFIKHNRFLPAIYVCFFQIVLEGIIFPNAAHAQWIRKDTLYTEPGCQIPVHYPAIGSISSTDTGYYYFNNEQCSPSGGSNVHYKLYRSTDSFQSWQQISTDPYSHLSCLQFVDAATGFIAKNVFGLNQFMKTTDAGNTWITLDTVWQSGNLSSPYHDLFMFNADSGYTISYDGILKKIIGNSVQTMSINTGGPVYYPQILFTNDNKGFMISYTSTISLYSDPQLRRSVDNGLTWDTVLTDTIGYFYDIEFADNYIGYLIGSRGLYKTIDGGATWNLLPNQHTNTFCLSVIDSNLVYISVYDSIFRTEDGGISWQYQPLPSNPILMSRVIYRINMLDSSNGYIFARNGLYTELYATNNGGTTSSISEINETNYSTVILPNPAESSLTIIFPSTYVGKPVNINAYNSAGKLIINKSLPSCEKQIELDLSSIQPGLYLIQTSSENGITINKLIRR